MPTSDVYFPSQQGKHPASSRRARTWVETPAFYSLAPRNRPINSYNDARSSGEQSLWTSRYTSVNKSTGAVGYATIAYPYNTYAHTNEQVCGLAPLRAYGSGYMDVDVNHAPALINEAILKALVNCADSKVNIAVMAAEARKTSDYIMGKADSVFRAWRAFRRGRFKDTARILGLTPKTVHKTWLEYKYAVTPLLMDAKGSAEHFAQQTLGGRPPEFVAYGKVRKELPPYVEKIQLNLFPASTGANVGHFQTITTNVVMDVTCKIWVSVDNPNFAALSSLGLTNPALVAWELVPFSFVFDWFVSVGDWLQGLTALHGLTVRKAMVSGVTESRTEALIPARSARIDSGTTIGTYDVTGQRVTSRSRNYERFSTTINPLDLYPPVDLSLNWNRLVTGLALLRARSRSYYR